MNLPQKRQGFYHIWNISVTLLSAVLSEHKNCFLFIFQTFLQLTTRSFTINTMQFTVSKNGTQLTLDFGPDSVGLNVRDLDENLTINPWKIRWQHGLCCCPKDKNLWTIICLEFP